LLLACALRISFFTVCTDLSTFEFPLGKYGSDGSCLNSQDLAKFRNSAESNCGPPSLITTCGIPCLANILFIFSITILLVPCADPLFINEGISSYPISQFNETHQIIFIK
jgi:hypothetical protein